MNVFIEVTIVYHVIIHKLEFLEHCVQWPNLVSQACFNN